MTKDELRIQIAEVKQQAADAAKEAQKYALPASTADWVKWLDDNDAAWKKTLKTATEERREHTQRMQADPTSMPDQISRIQPAALTEIKGSGLLGMLHGRQGWYAILGGRTGAVENICTIFLAPHARRTHYIDMACFSAPRGIYRIPPGTNLGDGSVLRPLPELAEQLGGKLATAIAAFEVDMDGSALPDGTVHLRPVNPRQVKEAQEVAFKSCASKLSADSGKQISDDSEDSLDKLGILGEDNCIASSEGSVDTDADICRSEEDDEKGATGAQEQGATGAEVGKKAERATGADVKSHLRAARGTFKMWDNGVFFISHTLTECRMRIYPQWASSWELLARSA